MRNIYSLMAMLILVVFAQTNAAEADGEIPSIQYNVDTYLRLPLPDGGEAHVVDPHVIKVDDTWYLYSTHRTRLENLVKP